ncbi:MAG TPA: 2,3-bisphosphoglycerate-independent phosphoglycerate mutase, partial [Sediminibacterium sp.]|nr:2,3-bisphosphoglycerate-independent phosphoglycerate mutase [Sediminibacterium sp.]
MSKKVILIIMDGWGLGQVKSSDAIQNANVPFVSSLYSQYPNTTLITCGEQVGLPEGQMGNSEVGHLNLGAGRIVYQELQRINVAVRDGSLATNQALNNAIARAKQNGKNLHLLGLVSDGGVHSHTSHLKAICSICHEHGLNNVFVHAFTDGRDTDPKSGLGYIQDVEEHLKKTTGTIATV